MKEYGKVLIVVGVVVAVLLAVTYGQDTQGTYPQRHVSAVGIAHARTLQTVEDICDYAHHEVSGDSEQACEEAQFATGTEYVCSAPSPYADCWVEVK
jgi:hypothetical protein